jgi:hypothetical protein
MTVEYQFEPADFHRFTEERGLLMPPRPRQWYLFLILPTLAVALAVVIDSFPIAIAFTVVYAVLTSLANVYARRRYMDACYTPEYLVAQLLPRRLTLAEDGVTVSSDSGLVVYRWQYVREIVRGSRYVHFMISPIDRFHVPVRAFAGEEEIERFLATARDYWRKATAAKTTTTTPPAKTVARI